MIDSDSEGAHVDSHIATSCRNPPSECTDEATWNETSDDNSEDSEEHIGEAHVTCVSRHLESSKNHRKVHDFVIV